MGKIVSIVYRPDHAPAQPADHYSRVALDSVRLLEGYGIEGDRKGGHPKRQINLMCQESLDQLSQEGFKTAPGAMGEQIIIEALDEDLNALPEGAQLQLGDEAIVELLTPRTGCDRFEAIQGINPKQAAGRLGMMGRVIRSGFIQVGDPVQVLQDVRVRHD